MSIDVTDNQAASRYEIAVDGTVIGFADYRRSDGRVVFPHTVITPSMRERGMAEILVRHALDAARRDGHVVVPVCWYVAQFIDEHPEYADLLEPANPPDPPT
ncbi:MAG TPA: GNAT family N-acetyltransferase [Ilumatobacteraceae bacterium]